MSKPPAVSNTLIDMSNQFKALAEQQKYLRELQEVKPVLAKRILQALNHDLLNSGTHLTVILLVSGERDCFVTPMDRNQYVKVDESNLFIHLINEEQNISLYVPRGGMYPGNRFKKFDIRDYFMPEVAGEMTALTNSDEFSNIPYESLMGDRDLEMVISDASALFPTPLPVETDAVLCSFMPRDMVISGVLTLPQFRYMEL